MSGRMEVFVERYGTVWIAGNLVFLILDFRFLILEIISEL